MTLNAQPCFFDIFLVLAKKSEVCCRFCRKKKEKGKGKKTSLTGKYSAPVGPSAAATGSSAGAYLASPVGRASKVDAKMTGMTPVALTLKGKYDDRARPPGPAAPVPEAPARPAGALYLDA